MATEESTASGARSSHGGHSRRAHQSEEAQLSAVTELGEQWRKAASTMAASYIDITERSSNPDPRGRAALEGQTDSRPYGRR